MNIPSITKALELDDADWDLAVKLRGLTEHQREQFSAALGPTKSSKKFTERVIEHCAACDYTRRAKVHKDATAVGYHEFQPSTKKSAGKGGGGKSKHASSLQQQIQGVAKGGTDRPLEALCVADLPNGAGRCGHEQDDPLHSDTSYGNAHTYQPPASSAARASGD